MKRGIEKQIAFDGGDGRWPDGEKLAEAIVRCLKRAGRFDSAELYLDTRKCLLIPAEFFDPSRTKDYLSINNIPTGEDEAVLDIPLTPGIVAVTIYPRPILDTVRNILGEDTAVNSPFAINLSHPPTRDRLYLALYLTPGNAYITICGAEGMEYCEVLPYSGGADILYYIQELSAQYGLGESAIYIRGEGGRRVAKLLKKYFRNTRCE